MSYQSDLEKRSAETVARAKQDAEAFAKKERAEAEERTRQSAATVAKAQKEDKEYADKERRDVATRQKASLDMAQRVKKDAAVEDDSDGAADVADDQPSGED